MGTPTPLHVPLDGPTAEGRRGIGLGRWRAQHCLPLSAKTFIPVFSELSELFLTQFEIPGCKLVVQNVTRCIHSSSETGPADEKHRLGEPQENVDARLRRETTGSAIVGETGVTIRILRFCGLTDTI